MKSETPTFRVGDRVRKVTGDYRLEGIVLAVFKTMNGKTRIVVEHHPVAPGLLHIYNPTQLSHMASLSS